MDTTTRPRGLYATSVVLASLTIAAPMLGGRIAEAILDTSNPAGLSDVSVGLAYLQEILIAGFSVLGVVVVAFLVITIALWMKTRSFRSVALPVLVFAVQLVVGIILLALGAAIN